MPVSSIVRTVRRARALLTYVGRVIGSGSHSEPSSARAASTSSRSSRRWCPRMSWSTRSRPADAGRGATRSRRAPSRSAPARRISTRCDGARHGRRRALLRCAPRAARRPGRRRRGRRGRRDHHGTKANAGERRRRPRASTSSAGRGRGAVAGRATGGGAGGRPGGRDAPARPPGQGSAGGTSTWPRRGSRSRCLARAGEDPHLVGVALDQPVARHLVVVLERLGDQVDGPREGEHHEDDCRQVHGDDDTSGERPRPEAWRCVVQITPVTGVNSDRGDRAVQRARAAPPRG